ncbi:monofunctional biosynthetic peptidoglycan transglycosylase [Larkinella arboricola]|uniref:Biosynthetic peptidoglycan transglycosylase n=1 Tax=Larkinella arboricola TaxID=643671 RepID=A0A327WTN0_LARAB|nr:monofunctional biosynthetic peptidoglycan transglycosylase [Larkinella arboricola]RAJ95477.1 monofunctional biosynthetic peptidoglycan transglycosylase [Larkinella arboricola]
MSTSRPVNRLRSSAPQPASPPSGRSPRVGSPVRHRPWLVWVGRLLAKLVVLAFLISFGWVALLKYLPVSITPLMIARKLEAKADGQDSKLYKDWTPYEEISKEAALAVVASEDQAFPEHWGFDFDEIQDAIKENKTRKRLRGASTISQQVAKNVFLWNGRSYLRKGLEVYFTFLIELIWGKERILEVYLNVAETGPLTFGVEAASRRYYGHSAKTLTRTEAARIAAVLPNPRLFSIKKPSAYIEKRTRQISRQMRYLGGRRYLENL